MKNETRGMSPNFNKAPERGWFFAETETGAILERYVLVDGEPDFPGHERLRDAVVTRIHCFDERVEYRWLRVNEKGGAVEGVFSAEEEAGMDPDLVYADDMILADEYTPKEGGIWVLSVINRYRWTETDTLTLENYRLAGIHPAD